MVKPTVYVARGEMTSPLWGGAFAKGAGGTPVSYAPTHVAGPIALFGSPQHWTVLQHAIAEGRDWYYGDKGYFGRDRFYRCTRNAYQHSGEGRASPARWNALGLRIRPWRRAGGHVLVCPPGQVFAGLMGFDADAWRRDVLSQLARATDRPVRVRPKSDARLRPLAADLRDCWALVTYMSNTAVEALLAGVPVFVLGPAAARRLALDDLAKIEAPAMPSGRRRFFEVLAANQWTLEEMARGELWRAIGAKG